LLGICVYRMFALFACDVGRPSTVMPDLVSTSVNNDTRVFRRRLLLIMRSLDEARVPWQTLQKFESLADLKEAIRNENEPDSVTKSRSLLWKVRIITCSDVPCTHVSNRSFSYSKDSTTHNGYNDQQTHAQHMPQYARIYCEGLNIPKKCWDLT